MRQQKYWFFIILFFIFSIFIPANIKRSNIDQKEILPVENIFTTGYLFQDLNHDSVIDSISSTIILPESPSETEMTCAANIGARLGYETSALDFDILDIGPDIKEFYDIPVIIISSEYTFFTKNRIASLIRKIRLTPGQGAIVFMLPNDTFQKGGILVSGYDDSGLLAASDYFSGRYPALWNLENNTFSDLVDKFMDFFDQEAIPVSTMRPLSIVVDNDKPGINKLSLQINTVDQDAFDSAKNAFDGGDAETKEKNEKKEKNGKIKPDDLIFEGLDYIELNIQCREKNKTINLRPEKPWQIPASDRFEFSAPKDMSLSRFFTLDGIFNDSNQDFIPDTVNAYISAAGDDCPEGLVNIALRVGLETAGMRFPFAIIGGEKFPDKKSGLPILYGNSHYHIRDLNEKNKLQIFPESENTGYIQYIPEAFEKSAGVIISGSDREGMLAITDYVSKRLPYLWDYGKGNYRLDDVETDVRRFFQVKSAAGQAAASLYKLKQWLLRLEGRPLNKLDIELDIKETPVGLSDIAAELVKEKFPEAELNIKLNKTGYGSKKTIFNERLDISWEVDEFWDIFNKSILPNINPDSKGELILRVSESPEIRDKIQQQVKNTLKEKGIGVESIKITVLCAYKQGLSWLYDQILPKIKNKKAASVNIKYHTLRDSEEIRWQTVQANTRWLQELFPIDVLLARQLNLPESAITFTSTMEPDPIYTVDVLDKKGQRIFQESFDPKYVIRPFFDLFPEYENVRVTTGWVFARIDGQILVDQRIKTDPEKFWDFFQKNTYQKLLNYVMDIQEGNPLAENAPYFDEFRIDLFLSEPNYRLVVDEEVISSTEALHEDILFHTLALFNRIGGRYDAGNLRYPGRILPHVHSSENGGPGTTKIVLTGKEKARPCVSLTYTEEGKEPYKLRFYTPELNIKSPLLRGIQVEYKKQKLSRLLFEVTAADKEDRYDDYKLRGSEEEIDRSFISVEKYACMLEILENMHSKGIFSETLNYDRIDDLMFQFKLEDDKKFSQIEELSRSSDPKITKNPKLWDDSFDHTKNRLVQWDTPIPPKEAESILSRLNTFPEINVYYMTRSFLGNNIFALDVHTPIDAVFVSQAKMNALKPTLLLYGRVHGNEVSSTSHILRLAELCAADPEYQQYLKNVNLVLYPITNPDGAQLAFEMYLDNPDYMLHAGRYGSLGTDVGSREPNNDNLYPETGMVFKLRETWLPDIVIDMHGVPSHEWVQYFAGYSAWVNSRKGGARSYWLPRGWYIPGFNWIEDDKHPDLMKAQKAITDAVVTSVTAVPEIEDMNKRIYERYIKYGRQDKDTYREYFYNGIQLEARLKSKKISEEEKKSITGPNVTYYSIVTEAADETAYGDWLKLVCKAGLAHSTALLKYLSEGENKIIQENKEYENAVFRRKYRKKPVLPKESGKEEDK